MSKSDRNILRYLSVMAVIPKLIKNRGNVSKTAMKISDNINNKFEEARALYPEFRYDSKDCMLIKQKIKDLNTIDNIHTLCLTSICLGGLEDACEKISGKRRIALESCKKILFRAHQYYDRNLNKWKEYDQATRIIKRWNN